MQHFGFLYEKQDLTEREKNAVDALLMSPFVARRHRVINAAAKSDLDAVRTLHAFPFKLESDGAAYHGAVSLCGKRICVTAFSADLKQALDVKVICYRYSEVQINSTGLIVDEEKDQAADLLELIVSHILRADDTYSPTALAVKSEVANGAQ